MLKVISILLLATWHCAAQFNFADLAFTKSSISTWATNTVFGLTNVTATTAKVSITPSTGALMIVGIGYRSDTSETITSVTDTGGSTYSQAFQDVNWTTHYTIAMFYSTVLSGVSNLTVTVPTSAEIVVIAKAYTGQGATPFEQASTQKTTTSTTPNSNSITTTGANDLLIGLVWNSGQTDNTADSPWTLITNRDGISNGNQLTLEERLNMTPAAYTANFTGANVAWACYIAAFK
jgi:hypothetical protein